MRALLIYYVIWHQLDAWEKIWKYENVNVGILYNPYGALRSIMYVFDNFGNSRTFFASFKNGLENQKQWPPPNFILSESWDPAKTASIKMFWSEVI